MHNNTTYIKVYLGGGLPNVGSSGFTNYNPTPETRAAAIKEVFEDFPNAVIVNGSDDWYNPNYKRPKELVQVFKLPILAYYHDGISGVLYSGIVLDKEVFRNFEVDYEEHFGIPIQKWLTIYYNETQSNI